MMMMRMMLQRNPRRRNDFDFEYALPLLIESFLLRKVSQYEFIKNMYVKSPLGYVQFLDQSFRVIIVFRILVKSEGLPIDFSDILCEYHFIQISLQSLKLKIIGSMVVGQDWNSIIDLEGVGIGSVVYQDYI